MNKLQRLYKEGEIYFSKEVARIDEELHFTTDIRIFWDIACRDEEAIALVASYADLNIQDLVAEENISKLIIHVGQYFDEASLFILRHKDLMESIYIADSLGNVIDALKWLEWLKAHEYKTGRLDGIRSKLVLLMEKAWRQGRKRIKMDDLISEYFGIFDDKAAGDVVRRALAMERINVRKIYNPARKQEEIDLTRIFGCFGPKQRVRNGKKKSR